MGGEILQKNIDRNIAFLDQDDLNIDQLDDPQLPTPGKQAVKVSKKTGKGQEKGGWKG